jgi:hypothetical protein
MNYLFVKQQGRFSIGKVLNSSLNNLFKLVYLPLRVSFLVIDSITEAFRFKFQSGLRLRKIRPTRYINRISCKIEEYSETIALAYVKLNLTNRKN